MNEDFACSMIQCHHSMFLGVCVVFDEWLGKGKLNLIFCLRQGNCYVRSNFGNRQMKMYKRVYKMSIVYGCIL